MKKILSKFIIFFAICGLCYSGYNLYSMWNMYHQGTKEYKKLQDEFTVDPYEKENKAVKSKKTKDTKTNKKETSTKLVEQDKTIDGKYPYYIDVDFNRLEKINKNVIGWIRIPNSVINYPILKSSDNKDYLHKDIYNKYLYAGSIFMNCNNSSDFSDKNTIIYGHNMKDGSMFASLNQYSYSETYYKCHKFVQIYQKGIKTTYCIVGYKVVQENDKIYRTQFANDKDYKDWLEKNIPNNASPYIEDKNIVTLSTCHGKAGGNIRFVLLLQKVHSQK